MHATECTFPRNPDRPVLCCDEFEGITKSVEEQEPEREPQGRACSGMNDSDPNGSAVTKGLCRTCSRSDTCTYPKPEGGVWHCDEYD